MPSCHEIPYVSDEHVKRITSSIRINITQVDLQSEEVPDKPADECLEPVHSNDGDNGKIIPISEHPLPTIKPNSYIYILLLQRKHPDTFSKFQATKEKKQRIAEPSNFASTQLKLFEKPQSVSTDLVNKLVINYIIKEMRPVCTVEKPAFVKLVEGLSGKKPCDRKTLRSKLEAAKSTDIDYIKKELAKTKYVCTAADIWSAQNKSYLGVTVHFIDDKNFERKSFVLCCKRFKFAHSFDKIAEVINEVHTF
ncbi:hypothetical protein ILUMI_18688 [Ignelater luminosus]|uniref:Uncharacterized protein n=1 Tax=Ignelater luminosus TaxID=2038154 RepID=A0A8K0CPL7_IGNLU|nr:hypothetical protein ILUMI_18688 [Ignelater luminosus]